MEHMMEQHHRLHRVQSALRPALALEIISILVLAALGVVMIKFLSIVSQWVRVCWHLRKFPTPKRVCKGPWYVPEALIWQYWSDPHLSVTARLFNFFKESVSTYVNEDFTVYFYGPIPILLVNTPMAMEAILRSRNNLTKPFTYGMMKTLMGTSLITSTKGTWRRRRRILNPAFHSRNLSSFVPVISRRCESLAAQLGSKNETDPEGYFDILTTLTSTTCGVLLETVLGMRVDDINLQEMGMIETIKVFCEGFMSRMANVLYWWDALYLLTNEGKNHKRSCEVLREYSRQSAFGLKRIYAEEQRCFHVDKPKSGSLHSMTPGSIMLKRKEELKAKGSQRDYTTSFLDILLQMHLEDGSFTEEEVLDETVTIFGAGFDTTATLAAYSLYLLGRHAHVQAALHDELDKNFGNDIHRPVTVDDLRRMRYLSCVIKETLRLYPSVPIMGRCIEEDMKIGNRLIPKGTIAMVLIYFLHRHPRFHKNPDSFTPERFLSEDTCPHPYAYMPFFGGPRNCIGQRFAVQEAKVVVAQIMRRFEIKSKLPEKELQLELGIVLRPSQGLKVRLTRRRDRSETSQKQTQ